MHPSFDDEVAVAGLTTALATIQRRFRVIHVAGRDPRFAMDCEFKVDAAGVLVIKQARPWVD